MKFFHAFSSLVLVASVASAQIRVGGSDLLAEDFAPALSEYVEARGIEAEIEFTGTYSAMEALEEGQFDLAIVAIPDGMDMPGEAFRVEYIGAKVLAVVVPEENPLSQITLSQLAGVFGEAASSNLTRWGELGLTGEWASRSILLASVSSAEHSLALDLFRHTVLGGGNMKATLEQEETIEAIRARFLEEENGIAILHRVPTEPGGLKVLPIAATDAELAYAPSPETVAAKQYLLRLPLYLVFPKENAGKVTDLLRFVVSDEAAEVFESSGLMPLSDVGRQRLSFEFGN